MKQYYQARLGQKDMQFCIDFAGVIDRTLDTAGMMVDKSLTANGPCHTKSNCIIIAIMGVRQEAASS